MRLAELAIGFLVLIFSILGYQYSSSLVETVQHMTEDFVTAFFPNIKLQSQSYVLQMGSPSVENITKIAQIGFIATGIIGVAFICFGVMAKKPISKQFSNISLETKFTPVPPEPMREDRLTNSRDLNILKERLARGEITEKEFEKLRRFFE